MAASQDLTMRMIPFLDRHLVFPLIEFLELKEVDINSDNVDRSIELMNELTIGLRSRRIAPSQV